MATSENKEIVKGLFATFGRGQILALRVLLAEDVIWDLQVAVPHNSGTYEGSSRVESFFENLYANVAVDAFEAREFRGGGQSHSRHRLVVRPTEEHRSHVRKPLGHVIHC